MDYTEQPAGQVNGWSGNKTAWKLNKHWENTELPYGGQVSSQSLETNDVVVWRGEGWCMELLLLIDSLISKHNCWL